MLFVDYTWRKCAVWALVGLSLQAEESALERQFREPPANATRPSIALALDGGGTDKEWFSRQLERVREVGAGGVLIAVPTANDAVWDALASAAGRAQQLGLEMGVRDFPLSDEEAAAFPHARKLVWSSIVATNQAECATNALPQVCQPAGRYLEIARLAVPGGAGEFQPHQIVDLTQGQGVAPTGGAWRVYRFGHADVEPPVMDGLEGTTFFRHVNQWLYASQNRLKQTYGNTVLWYQLSGPSASELVWPRDLPAVFLKRSGLGLVRYLPALADVSVGGAATAAFVRRNVVQAVHETWRERIGKNVEELVHEAGLEAGIRIDEVPVPPVETALYFRRPMLPQAASVAGREANVLAAGGARAMGRRYVIGQVNGPSSAAVPDALLLPFPLKPAIDRLLSAGATRILFEAEGRVPGEDVAFRQMRDACRYAHRCQVLLQQGEAAADFLVWALRPPRLLREYACDFTSGMMLETAAVKDGKIRFDSERAYGALAVTAEALNDKRAERMVRQMASRGVRVWLVPDAVPDEEAAFARLTEKGDANIGVARTAGTNGMPVADFQWRSEADGLEIGFLHRTSDAQETYFIVNDSAAAGPVTCTFRDTGAGVPSRWNPADGETGLVIQETSRGADNRVTASLFMAPHDAWFVVFDK